MAKIKDVEKNQFALKETCGESFTQVLKKTDKLIKVVKFMILKERRQ